MELHGGGVTRWRARWARAPVYRVDISGHWLRGTGKNRLSGAVTIGNAGFSTILPDVIALVPFRTRNMIQRISVTELSALTPP